MPRQILVRLALGHTQQIGPELLFVIGVHQGPQRTVVHTAEIAGVTRIAAAIGFGRAFKDQHLRARLCRFDGGTQGGIPATGDHHIPGLAGQILGIG